jgi:hypothetical protein
MRMPRDLIDRFSRGLRISLAAGKRVSRIRAFRILAAAAIAVAAVNVAVAVAVAAGSKHEASAWPGASFTFWPLRSWPQLERRIKALPPSARMQRRVIGETVYRQGVFAIHLLRFTAAQTSPRPLKVLLVSGVHGTELAGVEALLRLAEELGSDPRLAAGATIDIVPVANPWGWAYGYRYDGEGEDVNRDFSSGRTQEARFVRGLMDREGPYDLVMDLHESKKPGYFIYQYLPPEEGLGAQYVRLLKAMGLPRENTYREGLFRARDGILQLPTASLVWISLGRRLSLEHYARLHGTRHAYTVETPLSADYEERVAVHERTVLAFIDRLAAGRAAR